MASQVGEFRTRAAAELRDDFRRQHRDLMQGQTLQFAASSKHRARELVSFAANRAEAIRHHAGRIEEINGREQKAAQELAKRHDSLAGRMASLTRKGKVRQEQERQGLTDRFENDRMKQHRDLAALQERQFAAEQKARLRYGMELKIMREGHVSARQLQRGWQDDNRPRLTQQRVDHHQREAARTLQQDRQQGQEREPVTRVFNR
jgi:hypothetical protein